MKEIKNQTTYLQEYDVTVNNFLTYAQIQSIINAVIKFDTWSEREQNIDMLILHHATDISDEQIETIGVNALLQSGLIGEVKYVVNNLADIYSGLKYHESIERSLVQIIHRLDNKETKNAVGKMIKDGVKSKK